MINNEWVEMEIEILSRQRKRKIPGLDNLIFMKFFLMITAVFFCSPALEGHPKSIKVEKNHFIKNVEGGGVWFTCRYCRSAQWQDARNADWRGNFYCVVCRKKAD